MWVVKLLNEPNAIFKHLCLKKSAMKWPPQNQPCVTACKVLCRIGIVKPPFAINKKLTKIQQEVKSW